VKRDIKTYSYIFILVVILYGAILVWIENEAETCNEKYGIKYEVMASASTNIICQIRKSGSGSVKVRMSPFTVEKKTILGWVELKMAKGTLGRIEYLTLEENETKDFGISLDSYYGELEQGTYRLKNAVCDEKEKVKGYCYIVFEVRE